MSRISRLFHVPGCIIHQDTSYRPSAAKLFIQVPDKLSIPCSNKFVNMFIQLFIHKKTAVLFNILSRTVILIIN